MMNLLLPLLLLTALPNHVHASFSPSMTVQLKEGDVIPLSNLSFIGSEILTSILPTLLEEEGNVVYAPSYSNVYALLQYLPENRTEFLRFSLEQSEIDPLEITGNHFLFQANIAQEGKLQLVPKRADAFQVGDFLQTAFGSSKITSISKVRSPKGLVAPLTTCGTLLVNFVFVSSYMDYPWNAITQFTIAPFRLVCSRIVPQHSYCRNYTSEGLPEGLSLWKDLMAPKDLSPETDFLELQMLLFLVLAGIAWIMELVLSVHPVIFVGLLGMQRMIKDKVFASPPPPPPPPGNLPVLPNKNGAIVPNRGKRNKKKKN